MDSSPHCCDSRADIVRRASRNACHGIRFGTHAFPARLWQPCFCAVLFVKCASII